VTPRHGATGRPATPADEPSAAHGPHAGASRGVQSLAILPPPRLNFLSCDPEVPTLKGLLAEVPAFVSFEVTSPEQGDILASLPMVRDLVQRNDFVLVKEVNG